MAKKTQNNQQTENQQTKNKKEPYIYVGEAIANDKFFLRPGQMFLEIPLYVKDEKLRKKFIPVSQLKKQ